MPARLATAPAAWGVEPPGDPESPPRDRVLDEIHQAGYRWIELGPVGYLPEEPELLRAELESRELDLVAGYAMEPFHRPESRGNTLATVERTCRVLQGGGADHLILIEALTPERSATAGRGSRAERLDAAEAATQVKTIESVAAVAASFGLAASIHPHAGTAIEFRDEIDRLMESLDPDLVGLCVDTGHSTIAGIEPAELIEAYSDRLAHMHLKDIHEGNLRLAREKGASFEEGVEMGVFCRLGDGCVDFEAVAVALRAGNFDGYATVEQDRSPGDPAALEDARHSLEHALRCGFTNDSAPLSS